MKQIYKILQEVSLLLFYAFAITGVSELIYWFTKNIDHQVPIHLEVLLPAFILGCIVKITQKNTEEDINY